MKFVSFIAKNIYFHIFSSRKVNFNIFESEVNKILRIFNNFIHKKKILSFLKKKIEFSLIFVIAKYFMKNSFYFQSLLLSSNIQLSDCKNFSH